MNPPKESSDDIEYRMRFTEAAREIFKARFGEKYVKENEIVERAKYTNLKIFETAMQVLNADMAKGGAFDPNACSKLIEKMFLDSFTSWDKDEILWLLALVHTGIVMEQIQDNVTAGNVGKNYGNPDAQ